MRKKAVTTIIMTMWVLLFAAIAVVSASEEVHMHIHEQKVLLFPCCMKLMHTSTEEFRSEALQSPLLTMLFLSVCHESLVIICVQSSNVCYFLLAVLAVLVCTHLYPFCLLLDVSISRLSCNGTRMGHL